ncbi:unnamed protein product [Linum trigynum]|uniref:Isopenicillin N synthase-like Fe(2+) 2OG dioxygenase domain-containing protein n=1 Tax=Linum trigynum TaxID=586398 RepID=A0AAV2D1G7_9ROSI
MPAAGPASPTPDRAPPAAFPSLQPPPVLMTTDAAFAKDAILAWFRGEFAAANAIIDALCGHLAQLDGGGLEYDSVFSAIHRRRLNWIPVLQMQKYHSIADVAVELRRVTERKVQDKNGGIEGKKSANQVEEAVVLVAEQAEAAAAADEKIDEIVKPAAAAAVATEIHLNGGAEVEAAPENSADDSDVTDDSGGSHSQEVEANSEIDICSNHEECNARPTQIKLTKGFSAKEHVKGHMVNVVKGLKLFEDVFTDCELSKLTDFVNQLRLSGQNGQLSGDTFILFNKQMKGNKRELIQFGVPIFEHIKEDATNQTCNIEPIPALLEGVIDHLVQWRLIPEYRRPNGCIIHFFDEEEFSQPFQKPPHVDQPVATLLLSESTMAFGRTLLGDSDGNYRGPLVLSLKQGSLLVMRGNSADTARHVMCPSGNKRVSITLFRVRPDPNLLIHSPPTSPMSGGALTVWQPAPMPNPYAMSPNGYESVETMAGKWGVIRTTPVVMLAAAAAPMPRPLMVAAKRMMPPPQPQGQGGTGVFLPWNVGSTRKPAKHLPPRAQRGRYLALQPSVRGDSAASETAAISVGGASS